MEDLVMCDKVPSRIELYDIPQKGRFDTLFFCSFLDISNVLVEGLRKRVRPGVFLPLLGCILLVQHLLELNPVHFRAHPEGPGVLLCLESFEE